MTSKYGIDFNDQYGESVFQYGHVIADLMDSIIAGNTGDMWLQNHRGKAVLGSQKESRTFARVSTVRADSPEPDAAEIARMNDEYLPVLRVALPSGRYKMYYPKAFDGGLPFEGRQWMPNYADCYRLLLDYYFFELSIKLPVVVTPENYVAQSMSYAGQNLFMSNWQMSGFEQVMVPKHGDLIYMRTGNPAVQGPDHCAIYLEGDRILHHFIDRLSCIQEWAGLWRQKTVMILRHRNML